MIADRLILLERRLSRAETRQALAHEIAHLDLSHRQCRGVGPDGGRLSRRTERDADALAARRLVHIRDLAEAYRWTMDRCELAEELVVTLDVIECRLDRLRPSEKALLCAANSHHML